MRFPLLQMTVLALLDENLKRSPLRVKPRFETAFKSRLKRNLF